MIPLETPPSSTASSSLSPASPTDVRKALDDIGADNNKTTANHDNEIDLPLAHCRSLILELTVLVGNLCQIVLTSVPLDQPGVPYQADAALRHCGALIMRQLWRISLATDLDLETCIHKKMELNRQKYPVDLCKGKAGKYTEYSAETGITKHEGQSTLHMETVSDLAKELFRDNSTLDELALRLPHLCEVVRTFAEEREWARYHTPRNLVLALIGEMGELAELWQFRGDKDNSSWTREKHDKLGQEIADVTIYLIRLATICHMKLHEELPKLVDE